MTRKKNKLEKGVLLAMFAALVTVKIPTSGYCADLSKNKERLLHNKKCIGCDLRGVNLVRADLAGSNLIGANLDGAKFCLADLSGVDFTKASLRNTQFCGADISNAVFLGADISGSSFSGVYKKNTVFHLTDYKKVDGSETNKPFIKKRKRIFDEIQEEHKLEEAAPIEGTVPKPLYRFQKVKVSD